ncbi:MAG: hypothetical protein ACOZIN_07625 [Myxococcota bacterium]
MLSRLSRGAAALMLFAGATASATVVIAQSIEEMAQATPLIVRGTVGQIQVRWDEEHRRIHTYAEVVVKEALKGKAPQSLLVRQPGGIVGEIGQMVSGTARFTEGEEVVLFLEPAPDEPSVFGVWSLAAGKVTFERTAVGEVRAVRDLSGLSFVGAAPGGERRIFTLGERHDLGTPDVFLRRVRDLLRKGGAQ